MRAGLERLHDEVERPLVRVLARMEVAGVARRHRRAAPDRRRARRPSAPASRREIHELAGETFNVNSTPQLRAVLYDRLGLTPGRKTKTGFSTDASTLEKLRGQHPIVDTLLSYREVEKLRSTYGETPARPRWPPTAASTPPSARPWPAPGGCRRTGPTSTTSPCAPRRDGVCAGPSSPPTVAGCLVADYDQIELRVIAHLSDDPGLVAAFAEGRDIHRTTAASVFGVAARGRDHRPAQPGQDGLLRPRLRHGGLRPGPALVDRDRPRRRTDSRRLLRRLPRGAGLHGPDRRRGPVRGYTETLFGRRRPLPDLHSPNRNLRMAAERQAMNAGIQGLAADLFKVALVRLDAALEEKQSGARGWSSRSTTRSSSRCPTTRRR